MFTVDEILYKNLLKNILFTILSLTFFISCSETKGKKEDYVVPNSKQKPISENFTIAPESNDILTDWVNYYISMEPTFSLNHFNLVNTDTIEFIPGNVFGSFDENFDLVYYDFIVYNSSRTQYIDFDSYQWSLDENKEQSFSPDQEINLINILEGTVTRIGFRGPSNRVENAFWKNDSLIYLLENSYENIPIINEIDLKNRKVRTFRYSNNLKPVSEYSKVRFEKIRDE